MLVVVIFGASGDLAKRKTLPALYALFLFDQLPSCFKIIGYARSELTDTDFRDRVRPFLLSAFPSTEVKANAFLQHCQYMNGEYDSAERYQILYSLIESCEETAQASKYVSTNFPENFASQRDILNDHPRNHDFSHDSMYDKKYHTDCIEAISIDVGSNFEGKHSGGNSHKNVEVKESSPNFSPDITKLNESCIQCPPNAFSNVRIYYLALPPSQFGSVASQIHKNLIPANEKCLFRHRLIVEKPFGRDSSSSSALTTVLRNLFDEQCIYRIDHYLGKEMVKSIGTIRFANHIFSSLWSRHHIKSVQIVFKETLGVEGRGGYFDTYGIIRDVMQNHLLQILSLLAMEPPANFSADAIRDAKVAVLKCIKPIDVCGSENNLVPCALSPSNEDYRTMKIDHSDRNCNPTRDSLIFSQKIVLGQYSTNDDGLLGYLEDPSVPKNSNTPTFAMCILHVENQRWKGVPFILRCGKGLDEQKAEVRIQFHPVPLDAAAYFAVDPHPNELVIRVQPRESLYVKLNVKKPGFSVTSGSVALDERENLEVPLLTDMDLSYKTRYFNLRIPDAYESLLLEALRGDQANFVRSDELEEAWRIFTPLLHRLENLFGCAESNIDAKSSSPSITDQENNIPKLEDKFEAIKLIDLVPSPLKNKTFPELFIHQYPRGSRGPIQADDLLLRAGYIKRPNDLEYAWPVQQL